MEMGSPPNVPPHLRQHFVAVLSEISPHFALESVYYSSPTPHRKALSFTFSFCRIGINSIPPFLKEGHPEGRVELLRLLATRFSC
jgi:hypothetical protein